jgi:hypothetical protein
MRSLVVPVRRMGLLIWLALTVAALCALVLVYQLLTGPEPQPDIFHYDPPLGPAPALPVTPAP